MEGKRFNPSSPPIFCRIFLYTGPRAVLAPFFCFLAQIVLDLGGCPRKSRKSVQLPHPNGPSVAQVKDDPARGPAHRYFLQIPPSLKAPSKPWDNCQDAAYRQPRGSISPWAAPNTRASRGPSSAKPPLQIQKNNAV
eukprot:631485-Pelagomonas_calceolata.AAC.4